MDPSHLPTTTAASAPPADPFPLWPNGAPLALGLEPEDIPTLQAFLPAPGSATGSAIVVCPGGGYVTLAEHEGAVVARWLAQNGVSAFVLRYRLAPRYHFPAPFLDGQRAMRLARARAPTWGLDPRRIGMLGFSAGGHLTAMVATRGGDGDPAAADPVERVSARPDLQILVYPVITYHDDPDDETYSLAGDWSLLGESSSAAELAFVRNERYVTARTPPAFLVHSTDDVGVPVTNSDLYAASLRAAGVPYEYVRGALGGHGFGLQESWTLPCLAWLRAYGYAAEPPVA